MSMSQAFIKDALKRIEGKLDKLGGVTGCKTTLHYFESPDYCLCRNTMFTTQGKTTERKFQTLEKASTVVSGLTENQIKMAKVRAARKVNTGEGGRG